MAVAVVDPHVQLERCIARDHIEIAVLIDVGRDDGGQAAVGGEIGERQREADVGCGSRRAFRGNAVTGVAAPRGPRRLKHRTGDRDHSRRGKLHREP
jgi:hypothetical protein